MAKRFTATDKWEDKWFRKLKPAQKLFWVYLLDRCDMAGVIEYDLELAETYIGVKLDEADIFETFKNRIFRINGCKLWIPKFIEFQYGCSVQELDREKPLHRGVLKSVDKYNLTEFFDFLKYPIDTPDRSIDTPMVEVKVGVGVGVEKNKSNEQVFFKDGKLIIPEQLVEQFASEFGRDALATELPKMEAWLRFNEPKKSYKRFIFNWLNRSRNDNGNSRTGSGQDNRKRPGAGGASTNDDIIRTIELAKRYSGTS